MMKLHVHPLSPSCRNVCVTADHLGIAAEIHIVDAAADEHHRPEFLRLNPNGLFPVLEDGDFVLWESNAITQYLAMLNAGPLFPQEPRTRAAIARWQFWEQAHWTPACRPWMWENIFKSLKGRGDPDQAVLDDATPKFRQLASILDRHLEKHPWLVGNAITLADFAVASPLMYRLAGHMPLQAFENLDRWYQQVQTLPAWQTAEASMPPWAAP